MRSGPESSDVSGNTALSDVSKTARGLAVSPIGERSLDELADVVQRAQDYAGNAKSQRTIKAYASDWRDFLSWCGVRHLEPLPSADSTVALYLTDLAGRGTKAAMLARRLVAISQAHKALDLVSPTTSSVVRRVYAGIRRTHGTAQQGKAPTLVADIRKMVQAQPYSIRGLRDRALLLLGFAGAFRRSELVGLDVEDLEFSRVGLIVTLRRSKTDQEGQGRRIGIPYGSSEQTCPVRAVQAWLQAAHISTGPILRAVDRFGRLQDPRLSDRTVARLVKKHAAAIDLDPKRYAGHSLRAGLATSAAAAGISDRAIMRQTGHRSSAMVGRYVREGSLFRDNAAGAVGL